MWRNMAGGRPPSFKSFVCPNCAALYEIVKVEAGPEMTRQEVTCLSCGGPLPAREGKFVIKYFLLREVGRVQKSRRRHIVARKIKAPASF
jgi:RNase P subunit RPR2